MEHEVFNEDNWVEMQHIWEFFLGMDCLGWAFVYARFSRYTQKRTGFGLKDCLSLHSLGWSISIDESDFDEGDESVYT